MPLNNFSSLLRRRPFKIRTKKYPSLQFTSQNRMSILSTPSPNGRSMPLINANSATEAHGWQTIDPCHMLPQQYYCGSETSDFPYRVSIGCEVHTVWSSGGGPYFLLISLICSVLSYLFGAQVLKESMDAEKLTFQLKSNLFSHGKSPFSAVQAV